MKNKIQISVFLSSIFSLFMVVVVFALTFTSQNDDTSMNDTFLASAAPTVNYGTNDFLCVGEKNDSVVICRSVIKFDLSSIPTNATLTDATLYLYVKTDFATNDFNVRVHYLLVDFVEGEATWNKRNNTLDWSSPGGVPPVDYFTNAIGNCDCSPALAVGSEISLPLYLSVIQDFVNDPNYNKGFLLKTTGELNDAYYLHSSSSTTSTYRPKLVVNYSIPSTSTVTYTATITATNTATETNTPTATDTNTPFLTATNTYVPTVTETVIPGSTFTFTPSPTLTFTPTSTPGVFYTPVPISTAFYDLFNRQVPLVYSWSDGVFTLTDGVTFGTLFIFSLIVSVAISAYRRIR